MKLDPYNHKEIYLRWKAALNEKPLALSEGNGKLLMNYLEDMEIGINVGAGSKKGVRSFVRLKTLRDKVSFVMRKLEERDILTITNVKEEQMHHLFHDMRSGKIKKKDGSMYTAVADYVKIFNAFWHWFQKIKKKEGVEIPDLTKDLDTTREKAHWVYLTEEEVKLLCENAKYEYRVLIMFLLDSGIRSPTELMNVKVSDLFSNGKELNIREETSKTFGRRIKLLLCSSL